MSSHREAPEISKDPVADSTDTYAFVSTNPGEAGTVTLITNYIPLEDPAGGPNFYEFGDDVLYRINVDNNGDGWPDVTYEFTFPTESRKNSFLYNTGPIERSTATTGTAASTPRSPRCAASTAPCSARACSCRRATSGRARRRTTPTSPPRRRTTSATASGSSPANASTASTSTSARCSTSAPCARSRTST